MHRKSLGIRLTIRLCAFLFTKRNRLWNSYNRYVCFNSNSNGSQTKPKKFDLLLLVWQHKETCAERSVHSNLCNNSVEIRTFKNDADWYAFDAFPRNFNWIFFPFCLRSNSPNCGSSQSSFTYMLYAACYGIRTRLNGLCFRCSCVHWVRQLKRMFLRVYLCVCFFFFFFFSSIKMAHNDTKVGRKRHIQLRQWLPSSLACKNKHWQKGMKASCMKPICGSVAHTHTSNSATMTDVVSLVVDNLPNLLGLGLDFVPHPPSPKEICL